MDERYSIHNVTVQKLPPSVPRPKKKLSHTVKARPSGYSSGTFARIAVRLPIRRHHR